MKRKKVNKLSIYLKNRRKILKKKKEVFKFSINTSTKILNQTGLSYKKNIESLNQYKSNNNVLSTRIKEEEVNLKKLEEINNNIEKKIKENTSNLKDINEELAREKNNLKASILEIEKANHKKEILKHKNLYLLEIKDRLKYEIEVEKDIIYKIQGQINLVKKQKEKLNNLYQTENDKWKNTNKESLLLNKELNTLRQDKINSKLEYNILEKDLVNLKNSISELKQSGKNIIEENYILDDEISMLLKRISQKYKIIYKLKEKISKEIQLKEKIKNSLTNLKDENKILLQNHSNTEQELNEAEKKYSINNSLFQQIKSENDFNIEEMLSLQNKNDSFFIQEKLKKLINKSKKIKNNLLARLRSAKEDIKKINQILNP